MNSGRRTIYPGGLNKGSNSEFIVVYPNRETPEKGQRTKRPKPNDKNHKDEDDIQI